MNNPQEDYNYNLSNDQEKAFNDNDFVTLSEGVYEFAGIRFTENFYNLVKAFSFFSDYLSNKPVDLLDKALDPLYTLANQCEDNKYESEIQYLRYEIDLAQYLDDEQIITFFNKLKEARKSI